MSGRQVMSSILTSQHKTSQEKAMEMRRARAARQAAYNVETQEFEEKRLQKEQKKRLEKLERYKGVGDLGNKMIDDKLTDEERFDGVLTARYMQQEELQDTVNSDEFQLQQHGEIEKKRKKEQEKRLEKLVRYRGVGDVGHRLGRNASENVEQHFEQLNITSHVPDSFREMDVEEERRLLEEFEFYKKNSAKEKNNVNIYQAKPLVKRNEIGYGSTKSNLRDNTFHTPNLLGAASIPLQKSLKKEFNMDDEDSELENILKLCEKRDSVLKAHKKACKAAVNTNEIDTIKKSLRTRPARNEECSRPYNDLNRNIDKNSNKQMNTRRRQSDSNKKAHKMNHTTQSRAPSFSSSPEVKELWQSPEKVECEGSKRLNEVHRNVTSRQSTEMNNVSEPNMRMSYDPNLPSCSTAKPLNQFHPTKGVGEIGPKVLNTRQRQDDANKTVEVSPTPLCRAPSFPSSAEVKELGWSSEEVQCVDSRRLNEGVLNSNPSNENNGSAMGGMLGGNRRMFEKGHHPLLDKLTKNVNPPQ